jgi:hypothetical protein
MHTCKSRDKGLSYHVQQFTKNGSWFPLNYNPPVILTPIVTSVDWRDYCDKVKARPEPSPLDSHTENYRVTHRFLKQEGWIDQVEGKDLKQIADLVHLKANDPDLPGIVNHVTAFLVHQQRRLGQHYYARRLISTRPS